MTAVSAGQFLPDWWLERADPVKERVGEETSDVHARERKDSEPRENVPCVQIIVHVGMQEHGGEGDCMRKDVAQLRVGGAR